MKKKINNERKKLGLEKEKKINMRMQPWNASLPRKSNDVPDEE